MNRILYIFHEYRIITICYQPFSFNISKNRNLNIFIYAFTFFYLQTQNNTFCIVWNLTIVISWYFRSCYIFHILIVIP